MVTIEYLVFLPIFTAVTAVKVARKVQLNKNPGVYLVR